MAKLSRSLTKQWLRLPKLSGLLCTELGSLSTELWLLGEAGGQLLGSGNRWHLCGLGTYGLGSEGTSGWGEGEGTCWQNTGRRGR